MRGYFLSIYAVLIDPQHAWLAYGTFHRPFLALSSELTAERDAMGDDEYHPITQKGSNLTDAGGIGYTVIDSIDTMLLMGLDEEYARARSWVESSMSFDRDANFNTFETTIRVLGGLLSAFELTDGDQLYLDLATELADRMLPVFDTPSGLPLSMVNLGKRVGVADPDNRGLVSTAEASTLQLEFRYLGYLTDNLDYWDKAENVRASLSWRGELSLNDFLGHESDQAGTAAQCVDADFHEVRCEIDGTPVLIICSSDAGKFMTSEIRLGSRGDSYYEYLL